ncbi:MAG: sigma-54 dependent transcriptional regulator [bacterium]
MSDFSIFIVEDDPIYGMILERHLALNPDYDVQLFNNGQDLLKNLYRNPSVVSLDYSLPDFTGGELLKRVKQYNPGIQVVIVSGQDDIATAVTLLKEGAYDYLVKEENTRQRLWNTILKIKEHVNLEKKIESLQEEVGRKFEFDKTILGQSPAIVSLYSLIEKASRSAITVSITGDTGTGKELVAKAVHYASPRSRKPFVAVNMAAIPKDLLESELFGYEKGAFTGALARKTGKFEEADGGTLFLDEISEMDIQIQSKLLRALQEREVTRIGGKDLVKFDIRVITATHKDLPEEVRKGTFREDLYYRLLGLGIHLPPLRERGNDILVLAKHFSDTFCRENNLKKLAFSEGVKEKLLGYSYPGNVRELKAVMEVAAVMAEDDQLKPGDITFPVLNSGGLIIEDAMTLDDYCARIVKTYLEKFGDISIVAEKLKIGKSTIYRMKQDRRI